MDSSGFGFALAPRRDVLDSLLVQRATECGADFADQTRAERLIWEDDRVTGAELRDADGERREVRARVVIGADGKFSSVAKWVRAESYEAVPALRPIYYGHFHGIDPLSEPAVELFYGGDRIAFIFPMRRGEDCLALELQPEDFERFRVDPKGKFRELFERQYGMRARMRNADLDGKLIGTKGIENYFRKPFGPGWVLTGDAGYLKDPSTGSGIGDALQQSFWLADALDDCFQGAAWDERMGAFQQLRDTTMLPIYQSTLNFTRMRDPDTRTIDLIRAAMSAPGLSRSFVYSASQTMGQALPPPLMARLQGIAQGFEARRVSAAEGPLPVD